MVRHFIITLFVMNIFFHLQGQNIGIGTLSPQAKLHIRNDFELLRLQGTSSYIAFYDNANSYKGYLWNKNNASMELGTPVGSNLPISLSPNTIPALTVVPGGMVGIGVSDPAASLEVSGRVRIRHNTETAGIHFNNSSNTISPGFVGMFNDNTIGFYGTGSSWQFLSNTNTGNVSIGGGLPGNSKLLIEAGNGNALEISGAIKVSGAAPSAFQVIADASNLGDRDADLNYQAIIIDNTLCNNDPNAILIITQSGFQANQCGMYVVYDNLIARWKIKYTLNWRPSGWTAGVSFRTCSNDCGALTNVILGDFNWGFQAGNRVNVLVIKR